jgi:murein hydrolase activator
MKKILFIVCCVLLVINVTFSQSKKEIEKRIENTKREIELTSKLIKETEQSKKQSYSKLELISRKIELRKDFINDMSIQLTILNTQLLSTQNQVSSLSKEISNIKAEYAKIVYYEYINRNAYDRLMFILSSEDFNQAYKRLKYLQFYTEYRRFQVSQIISKTKQLNQVIASYNATIAEKATVVQSKQKETESLAEEQDQKSKEITVLESRQKELKDDLQKKLIIAEKLKNEIARIIAEEQRKLAEQRRQAALAAAAKKAAEAKKVADAKKAANAKLAASKTGVVKPNVVKSTPVSVPVVDKPIVSNPTPVVDANAEDIVLTGKFSDNIGKLPWPSSNGVITQPFGEHPHPMFPSIKITNNGIDITCSKNTQARAVYEGEVTKIIIIPGANSAVLVRHGNYITVYSNLVNVLVKQGQKIKMKQVIGTIFNDEETDKTTMNFQIWKETTKLDPQKCLLR